MRVALAAAALLALGHAGAASASPPVLDSTKVEGGRIHATYLAYSQDAPYVVEMSDSPAVVKYGLFASVLDRADGIQVAAGSDHIDWLSSKRFAPGTYYIHAALDTTASYIDSWTKLCEAIGCTVTIPAGFRELTWSGISTVVVPRPCVVPSVRGSTLRLATRSLRAGRCELGRVTRRFSDTPKGRVVSQGAAAGKTLPNGTRVNLVVSRGAR